MTYLDNGSPSTILNAYARRWAKEVRVRHVMLLPVLVYSLLLRLYGSELEANKGFSLFALKHRFMEDAFKERLDRSEHKWRKKLDQLRAAA